MPRIAAVMTGLLVLAAGTAWGQGVPQGASQEGAQKGTSKGPTIAVDPAACQWAVRHEPAPDVAYQPGVDVDGNPVAPADLDGGVRLPAPQRIEIPLTARLARALPQAPGTARSRPDAYLGLLTVVGDQVLFDGQPLTDPAADELAALCRQQGLSGR
ncbi:hypothetical protein [Nitrospirillum amazonense]|uniref:Uncharacterized protein n=1 Tax=Nitrospirillum amazonense TaxID=28077 RepID=A0A560KGV7_9PROT|nr:hypothetical protein [Nitrospirillum amazonense]MDG3443332.1 hypothetical protein [Nitrospirillum amazonense]TWB82528.1 hypothetical protein FBZ87_101232 [Nitrospirillum amazonense]